MVNWPGSKSAADDFFSRFSPFVERSTAGDDLSPACTVMNPALQLAMHRNPTWDRDASGRLMAPKEFCRVAALKQIFSIASTTA